MITIAADPRELANDAFEMRRAREEFRFALARAWAEASERVAAIMRDRWLSGRFAGDLGLNIVTGNLHDSVRAAPTTASRDGVVEGGVRNRGADYWRFHPIRFPAWDIFTTEGERAYASAFDEALGAIA